MFNSCMNIQHKGSSFKKNGELSSYGLRQAIELISNANLSRAARVILSQVCKVAAATSAYKITMSRKTMAELCGTTEATIRRNMVKVVEAGILTSTLVFDNSPKGRGQMPTEYQFTRDFISAAMSLCKTLDSRVREAIEKAKSAFACTLHSIRDIFSGEPTPRSNLPAAPDQIVREILVSFDVKNSKDNSAPAEKVSVIQKVKSWTTAKSERATTQANDYSRKQMREREERQAERQRLEKAARRHAFVSGKPATSRTTSTSFNSDRFSEANRLHDEVLQNAAERTTAAKARGFNPANVLARHFPNRKTN